MAELDLWQEVLARAIADTNLPPTSAANIRDKRDAISWLNTGGKDFRMVCDLAGMDPAFIHDAWKSGRLAGFSKTKREKECA